MNSGQKKGINFDLDTNALKITIQKGTGVMHTMMSESDVMTIVYRMTKRFPWINYCVSVCTLADVPEAFDISHVFVREAERLDEAMTSTTQGIDTLSM